MIKDKVKLILEEPDYDDRRKFMALVISIVDSGITKVHDVRIKLLNKGWALPNTGGDEKIFTKLNFKIVNGNVVVPTWVREMYGK
jgi:hypothetical protein